ncbi:hypothetical protein GV64_04295 [Endozoicomonas elysicola]|uniref:Uncharacterized protein n=1 Tax=Endozoicomonas elysicola TaxID=305900 RepID=A0A081K7E1_9GAMM|nr:hypothetical protein GV64_04295 [Endozoicomonas elysicola]
MSLRTISSERLKKVLADHSLSLNKPLSIKNISVDRLVSHKPHPEKKLNTSADHISHAHTQAELIGN